MKQLFKHSRKFVNNYCAYLRDNSKYKCKYEECNEENCPFTSTRSSVYTTLQNAISTLQNDIDKIAEVDSKIYATMRNLSELRQKTEMNEEANELYHKICDNLSGAMDALTKIDIYTELHQE